MIAFKKKIFGVTWTHKFPKSHPNLEPDDDSNAGYQGTTTYPTCEIIISGKMTEGRQELTLLHEHIHIVSFENSLNLKEKDVKCLTAGLFAIGYRMTNK